MGRVQSDEERTPPTVARSRGVRGVRGDPVVRPRSGPGARVSDTLVFDVKGSRGEGIITAECVTQDDGSELVVWAKLELPGGREFDLLEDTDE